MPSIRVHSRLIILPSLGVDNVYIPFAAPIAMYQAGKDLYSPRDENSEFKMRICIQPGFLGAWEPEEARRVRPAHRLRLVAHTLPHHCLVVK